MACHIIMDAMGGDHAPGAIVQGAVQALSAFEGTVTMYGMEDAIRKALDDCDSAAGYPCAHTDSGGRAGDHHGR